MPYFLPNLMTEAVNLYSAVAQAKPGAKKKPKKDKEKRTKAPKEKRKPRKGK